MLHEVVKKLPADRILVETDCPFLTPEPFRGKRNEPAYVKYTAAACAKLRGEPPEAFMTTSGREHDAGVRDRVRAGQASRRY